MPPPMRMPPRPPGFIPPPMQYGAMLSKPPELSKQSEDGKILLIYGSSSSYDKEVTLSKEGEVKLRFSAPSAGIAEIEQT